VTTWCARHQQQQQQQQQQQRQQQVLLWLAWVAAGGARVTSLSSGSR